MVEYDQEAHKLLSAGTRAMKDSGRAHIVSELNKMRFPVFVPCGNLQAGMALQKHYRPMALYYLIETHLEPIKLHLCL